MPSVSWGFGGLAPSIRGFLGSVAQGTLGSCLSSRPSWGWPCASSPGPGASVPSPGHVTCVRPTGSFVALPVPGSRGIDASLRGRELSDLATDSPEVLLSESPTALRARRLQPTRAWECVSRRVGHRLPPAPAGPGRPLRGVTLSRGLRGDLRWHKDGSCDRRRGCFSFMKPSETE